MYAPVVRNGNVLESLPLQIMNGFGGKGSRVQIVHKRLIEHQRRPVTNLKYGGQWGRSDSLPSEYSEYASSATELIVWESKDEYGF